MGAAPVWGLLSAILGDTSSFGRSQGKSIATCVEDSGRANHGSADTGRWLALPWLLIDDRRPSIVAIGLLAVRRGAEVSFETIVPASQA
jgi:hypothetical protein